jgi:hypothetical protein
MFCLGGEKVYCSAYVLKSLAYLFYPYLDIKLSFIYFMLVLVVIITSTNDRLSVWQLAWIEIFRAAGVPFEESRVNWKK